MDFFNFVSAFITFVNENQVNWFHAKNEDRVYIYYSLNWEYETVSFYFTTNGIMRNNSQCIITDAINPNGIYNLRFCDFESYVDLENTLHKITMQTKKCLNHYSKKHYIM